METPEQSRGTRSFRQWDDNGTLSVAIYRELETTVGGSNNGENDGLWPIAAVDTLLTAWGYDCEALGWLEVDALLWCHIYSLFSLFTEYDLGGPAPLKYKARLALDEYDSANASKPNRRSQERDRLYDEQEKEKIDNSRWLAEYTMKWLDAGLRLLEAKEGKR